MATDLLLQPGEDPKDLDITKPDQLQELCLSLLETLNDRMLQFKQQKRANKQLMARLEEVENQIQIGTNLEIGQLITNPSSFLMKDYSSANIDAEVLDKTNVNEALFVIDNKIKESHIKDITSNVDEPFTPDVADLYKRFQKLTLPPSVTSENNQTQSNQGSFKREGINESEKLPSLTQNHPPPDLIAQDFIPRGVSYHTESLSLSDIENDNSGDEVDYVNAKDEAEKQEIILPEHLQRLVDKAMLEIVKEAEKQ